ncbi:YhcN/YlaJ family sporulation lipoprotein [Ornithinibacillus scapharcae]|uniref:YhcN/YlaJ family sporulation lipoprotein n=1 Tax=Ornithinibacillus scapharcae TaxID=1147159 RepID=UPI000225BE82|nr:YhcN/YlaJ family sporulation lipoprotein [Ornithinibacillus scapharcae]
MRGKILMGAFLLFLTAGCGNEREEGQSETNNNQYQPINYETPEEQTNRTRTEDKTIGELGGYPQSDQEFVNEGDKNLHSKNEDRYSNERTMLISEYLAERKEIVQAQVAETDERIIVAVITPDNEYYPNLNEVIEEEVKRVVPDKQIVVYTQAIWWDRMRNLNSSPNDMDEKMRRNMDDFFGNE